MLKYTGCCKKTADMHNAVNVCFVTGGNVRLYKNNYSVFAWYVHWVVYFKVWSCDQCSLVTH